MNNYFNTGFKYACELCGKYEYTSYSPPDWLRNFEQRFNYCDDCKQNGKLKEFITKPLPCPICECKTIGVYKHDKGYICFCINCGLQTNGDKYSTGAVVSWNKRK